ncbi:MAG TPA: hypothetical protein VE865_09815, partial [Bradyrhizobium sp.]|nr:hypothetical protein [Bradyrhizobium sp.]
MLASIVLTAIAALLWVLSLATLATLGGSDAAGNALGEAYAAFQIIALWTLLFVMVLIAAVNGSAPWPATAAAVVMVPLSGFVTMSAAALLARAHLSPYLGPIAIPAAIPPLVVLWCFLSLRGGPRRALAALPAAMLAVCLLIQPLSLMRKAVDDRQTARLEKYDADLARVPTGAPIWEWTPFLDTRDETKRAAVLANIRGLEQRQAQAELMLERGDFPVGYLGFFDLDPTPGLCDKARGLLRRQVEPLVLKSANARSYRDIAGDVADAVAGMSWLVGYGCSCDRESRAWEAMANGYTDTGFDVHRLVELRDPKELGRIARERPERFSMLNENSHLKAWLRFADDPNLRQQALAGARRLAHRSADAVAILINKYDEESRWRLMRYLAVLDLETTLPLCADALGELHAQFAKVYRPAAGDEARSYSELLARLGNGEQFPDLIWLAGHGCDAKPELDEGIALINAYGASPGSAEML